MKPMIEALISLLLVTGVCAAAGGAPDSDAAAFQAWQRLLNEAEQAAAISSEQDFEEATLKLLAALDVAKGLTPLEEAKTLEELAQLPLTSPDRARSDASKLYS